MRGEEEEVNVFFLIRDKSYILGILFGFFFIIKLLFFEDD